MSYTSRYRNWIIAFSLYFILILFALIGFSIIVLIPPGNNFFGLAIEWLKSYSLFIYGGLIFMAYFFGIPLIILWWLYFKSRDPIIKKDYTVPELKEKILQILTKKKGKYIYPTTLMKISKFKGTIEELKTVLQQLRQENQIVFDKDDFPYYSVKLA